VVGSDDGDGVDGGGGRRHEEMGGRRWFLSTWKQAHSGVIVVASAVHTQPQPQPVPDKRHTRAGATNQTDSRCDVQTYQWGWCLLPSQHTTTQNVKQAPPAAHTLDHEPHRHTRHSSCIVPAPTVSTPPHRHSPTPTTRAEHVTYLKSRIGCQEWRPRLLCRTGARQNEAEACLGRWCESRSCMPDARTGWDANNKRDNGITANMRSLPLHSRAKQSRAEQSRAEQSRAERHKQA